MRHFSSGGHIWAYHPNRRQRAFYRLHERFPKVIRYTCARLSEVFWLQWKQIDLERGIIRVEKQARSNVKERREKILPIPQVLGQYLAAEREANPDHLILLDNSRGELAYRSPAGLTPVFQRHLKDMGLAGKGVAGAWLPRLLCR